MSDSIASKKRTMQSLHLDLAEQKFDQDENKKQEFDQEEQIVLKIFDLFAY